MIEAAHPGVGGLGPIPQVVGGARREQAGEREGVDQRRHARSGIGREQHEQQAGRDRGDEGAWCSRPRMRGFGRSWIGIARRVALSASTSGSTSEGAITSRVGHIDFPHDDARGGVHVRGDGTRGVRQGEAPRPPLRARAHRLQEELVKMEQYVADRRRASSRSSRGATPPGRAAPSSGSPSSEPARHPDRRAAEADERERSQWYFERYLERAAGRGRDRPVRSQLVQPRRRRARARVLHARGVLPLPAADARSSSGCSSRTASCSSSTGSP